MGSFLADKNTQINMATRKMAVGFDFLKNSAGFAVAWTPLDYKPSDSYLWSMGWYY